MLTAKFITFVFFIFLGLPVALTLMISSVVPIVFFTDLTPMLVVQRMFFSLNSFSLLAIPLFMIAGAIMERGGVAKRLVDFAMAAVGWMPGGASVVIMMTGMLFGATTGSSTASSAAIGTVIMPGMLEKGYDKKYVMTSVAFAGFLGVVLPPSMPMIVYGNATGADIGALFVAGIIPAFVLFFLMGGYSVYYGIKNKYELVPFDAKLLGRTFLRAIWALLMPVFILYGIYGGFFTPTETGAIACLYALFIGFFVYRELTIKKLFEALEKSAVTISMLLFIIGCAATFGWLLAWADVPEIVGRFITGLTDNPYVFIFIVVVVLTLVCSVMDPIPAIMIMAPILHVIAPNYGFSEIHFSMIVIITISISVCTPPVGINLFVASSLVKGARTHDTLNRHLVAYYSLCMVGLALLVAFPQIVEFLPNLLR